MFDRPVARQILHVVNLNLPIVHLVAALVEQIGHHILARTLGAPGARNRDEILRGGDLLVEMRVHGITDAAGNIGIDHDVSGSFLRDSER
jgi:hypothetical protein